MPDALTTVIRTLAWGACPIEGILTAGQPTAPQLAQLATAGLRTVVDVRGTDEDRGFEEAAVAARLGLSYVPIPVTPDTLDDAQFDRARAVLADPAARPVLLHCRSANRSGALLYPWLVLDHGIARARAFDLACAVGLRHPGYAERTLAYVTARS